MAKVNAEVAHFAGVETCGRVWLCPVCSAKIRLRRGEDVAEGAGRWLSGGGGVYFLTATLPHEHGDALEASLGVLTKAWRFLTCGEAYQTEKDRLGYVGNIKSVEITHGRNGWHPHAHCVMFTVQPLETDQLGWWYPRLDARWARALTRNGWSEGQAPYRLRLDMVNRDSVADLAAYVTKLQDGRGLGNEIARADLKNAKGSSRTPFQVLADFGTWGEAADLSLWHEYENSTAGKSAIRWSRGLRGLLLPDSVEQTDEEIAAENVGGEDVCAILPRTWYAICDTPGAEVLVLRAIEEGGMQAVIRVLAALRIDPTGVLSPQEWAAGQA
jgi:hypothetical protein